MKEICRTVDDEKIFLYSALHALLVIVHLQTDILTDLIVSLKNRALA